MSFARGKRGGGRKASGEEGVNAVKRMGMQGGGVDKEKEGVGELRTVWSRDWAWK